MVKTHYNKFNLISFTNKIFFILKFNTNIDNMVKILK